jgi:hypothetical protein
VGLYHSPRIVTDGLVLCLDAANTKGYDKFENLRTNSNTGGFFPVVGSYTSTGTSTDILAPDGSNTTYKVVANGTQQSTIDIAYQQITLTAGQTYTVSVYYYATGSTTSSRNLGIQVFGNGSAFTTFTPPQNTWVRQSLTFTASSTSNTGQIRVISNDYASFNSQSGATVYLWGAQLERGSSVTDYYATTSTAKNRGTIWTDLSIGGGNNGTLTNGPTYSSSNGGSIVFDGTNDYIVRNSTTINLSAGVTMEMIFKSTDMNSRAQGFMQFNTHPNYINFYTPGNGYLRWETWVPVSVAGGAYTTPTTLSNNTWYHAVGTYSNGSSKLYINGINVSSASQTSGTYSSSYTANLVIGEYAGYMSGNVALAKIYNRALTALEVQQNFNAQRGRFGI